MGDGGKRANRAEIENVENELVEIKVLLKEKLSH